MSKQKRFQSPAEKQARRDRRQPIRDEQRRQNRLENEARAARNRELRAQGLPTPFEEAKAKRKARRDQLRAEGKLPPIGTTRAQWEAEQRRKAAH